MELDDLKKHWQKTANLDNSNNQNIIAMIYQKSHGPVASLKRSYKKQMVAMTLAPVFIIATNLQHIDKTLTSALFWFYILFCIGVIAFAKKSYAIVKKMEGMDGMVKSNLELQLMLLEKRQKQNINGIRIGLLFFIVLTEMLPYFQDFRMLNTWNSLSPFIRFGAYAILLLFQYAVSRSISYRKFGQHIDYLKNLVQQMQ